MQRQFRAMVSQRGLEFGWDLFGILARQFADVMPAQPGLIHWRGEAIPMGGDHADAQMYAIIGTEIGWEAII